MENIFLGEVCNMKSAYVICGAIETIIIKNDSNWLDRVSELGFPFSDIRQMEPEKVET